MSSTSYAIGLGSNRPHGRHGRPERVIAAALVALRHAGVSIEAVSRTLATPPLGPGGRRYANAAALIATPLPPPALLALLKRIEADFGRRRGRRWGPRVIDLDILLWGGGGWRSPGLMIPHAQLAHRGFVLLPLLQIARHRRLPGSARSVAHAAARFSRPRAVDRARPGS